MAKAPKNATYTSPQIQKEILHVISTKVKKAIREEIGDAKFCILVDEAHDECMKEQMAVVLRYVDINGFVREWFYGIVHVVDIAAITLKKEIYYLFSNYCLDIQNIGGKDMMVQATYGVSGMDYKLWFWMIVHMLTTFIVLPIAYNWH